MCVCVCVCVILSVYLCVRVGRVLRRFWFAATYTQFFTEGCLYWVMGFSQAE